MPRLPPRARNVLANSSPTKPPQPTYGCTHQVPKSPTKTPATEISLPPRTEDMMSEALNRSPPLTCRTLPRHNLSLSSPTTQELIRQCLDFTPKTPDLRSPASSPEATPHITTPPSRSPSPDIAPPMPLHSQATICPNPDRQIEEMIKYLRRTCRPNREPKSPVFSPPATPPVHQSSPAREHQTNLENLRNALAEDESLDETQGIPSQPPRPPSPVEPQPPVPQRHENDIPPTNLPDPPSFPEADDSLEIQLPTTASAHLQEFQAHWATTFATDLTWEDFSEQCSLFADATRTLANNLRMPHNQTNAASHNQNTTTTHQPRGNRPTRRFNPAEARRIQGMYRHSKKRAARKILANNTTTYAGSKQTAQDFFTATFAHRPCNTDTLLHHLQNAVPTVDEENNHLADPISEDEIQAKLRSAANTSPAPTVSSISTLNERTPSVRSLRPSSTDASASKTYPKRGKTPPPSSSTKRMTQPIPLTSGLLHSCHAYISYSWV